MNPFDTKLHNSRNRIPSEVNSAVVWVHDTLEFCLASAQTHFGDDVSPLIALEIYDRVVQRIESEKLNEKIIDAKLDELADQRLSIEEMVKGITPENRHEEIDWGRPVGKEFGASDD